MKIFVPSIEIKDNEGFTPENDIFKRKPFGESLQNIIKNTDDELVIALDAPWGEGKTTFIKQWRALLKIDNESIHSIYFDAFENDYHKNAFLALSRHIYQSIKSTDKSSADKFKDSAMPILKKIATSGVKVAIKAATLNIIDDSVLEGAGIGDEINSNIDNYLSSELTSLEADKQHLTDFKEQLKILANNGDNKKLVFIIDELDRCKPRFALEILESIKHLFSVPNLVFLLVINRKQIEESIRCEYGHGVEATTYLQKFIHIWASFPVNDATQRSISSIFINNALAKMDEESHFTRERAAIDIFINLSEHLNLSLREIEKSLTNYAILYNSLKRSLSNEHSHLIPFISIIKTKFPLIFKKLSNNKLNFEELIKEVLIQDLPFVNNSNNKSEHPLIWLLKYLLASEDKRLDMNNDSQNDIFRSLSFEINILNDLCNISNSFRLN